MGHREFTTSNCHPGAGISSIQRSPSVESSELVALQSDGVSCTKVEVSLPRVSVFDTFVIPTAT